MINDVVNSLIDLGWKTYDDEFRYWRYGESNRYVDIELPYIDIYCYADEEKYGSWLSSHEFALFNELITNMYNLYNYVR